LTGVLEGGQQFVTGGGFPKKFTQGDKLLVDEGGRWLNSGMDAFAERTFSFPQFVGFVFLFGRCNFCDGGRRFMDDCRNGDGGWLRHVGRQKIWGRHPNPASASCWSFYHFHFGIED